MPSFFFSGCAAKLPLIKTSQEGKNRKMKTRKYYLTLLIVFIVITLGCQNTASEKENDKRKILSRTESESLMKEKAESEGIPVSWIWGSLSGNKSHASFSAKINDKLPELNFKIVGRFDKFKNFSPSYVEIRNVSNRKLIQKIFIGDKYNKEFVGNSEDSGMIQLVDLNFDGYLDFRILTYRGATGCNNYISCLYNPALKKYAFNKQLSEMSALNVHAYSKQLTTYDRGGWCEELIRYFEVIDDKFMLTKAEWTTYKNINSPCNKLTGVPLKGHAIYDTDKYAFLDSKGRLRKKLRIIKKEEVRGSIDGQNRNAFGVPIR